MKWQDMELKQSPMVVNIIDVEVDKIIGTVEKWALNHFYTIPKAWLI